MVAKSCSTDIVTLSTKKVNAAVDAALTMQASTITGRGCTEATTGGHTDNGNRGQRERLSVDDSEPQFFHWIAPPGGGQRLYPDRGVVNYASVSS